MAVPETGERSLVACAPVPVFSAPEPGSELVTELVVGETLVVLEERGSWLRVVVPEHPTSLDDRGYPGWAPSEARLAPAAGWSPSLVVIRPNEAGLPLGALLRGPENAPTLPDGQRVAPEPGTVTTLGESAPLSTQETALELARPLLGLPYRWGGTDSTTGLDCSGLVYRIMRLIGKRLPRDSGDQFARAPFKSRAGWEEASPGDLVFFGAEDRITHVGFYLGGGEYISEHGGAQTGCATIRAVNEDPYRGFARYREPDPREATAGPPLR